MMKALILSFFTFLSIYIEGLEIFPFPQLFFENIKMQPRYNRKSYSLIFIPRKSFNCDGQFVVSLTTGSCYTPVAVFNIGRLVCFRYSYITVILSVHVHNTVKFAF